MSRPLLPARLIRLTPVTGSGRDAAPRLTYTEDDIFPVQLNPTSLRISRQNNVDVGGHTTKTQARQHPSVQSATLSFDLEFDTAEEIDSATKAPLDVRTRTQIVRQFTEPSKDKPEDPPPPVLLSWGTFSFTGIVSQLTEELDYFSPEGSPLRAKVSVTITEQNLDFAAHKVAPGTLTDDAATKPGAPPGSGPAPRLDTAATAQEGESVQQLLARLGADPATWRSAMTGLDSPLALDAGTQVGLSVRVTAGRGVGVTAGFAAAAEVRGTASLSGALGLAAGAGPSTGDPTTAGAHIAAAASVAVGLDAGFVLAEGGGIHAAAAAVVTARTDASAATARAAFGVVATAPSTAQWRPHTPPPAVDPRSSTYGRGIPLRARLEMSAELRT